MALRIGIPAKLAATDANDTRYDWRNLVVGNNDSLLSPRGGVTSPVGVPLVTATATMNVTVAPFNAVAVRDGGVVLLANDAPINVLLAAAPSANSRIDVIFAKQNDASSTVATSDGNNLPVLGVATGIASATPVKQALTPGSVELATVVVPSTATTTQSANVVITQTAQFTAAPGGAVPLRTFAELAAWSGSSIPPVVGQHANVFADPTAYNKGTYTWNGTQWFSSTNAPYVLVYQVATISPPSGTNWVLNTHYTAQVQRGGMTWGSGYTPVTIPLTGVYEIKMRLAGGPGTGGSLKAAVNKNLTSTPAANVDQGELASALLNLETKGDASFRPWIFGDTQVALQKGDTLTFTAFSNQAAQAFPAFSNGRSFISVRYIQPA